MIPVFNAGQYLEQALVSVIQQAPGPEVMEIVVVDDASNDIDVEGLVRRVGGDRVAYFRQPANVGSLWNFHTCLTRARGLYVHLLHADDRVLPGYYAAMEMQLMKHPEAAACFSRYRYVNGEGELMSVAQPEASSEGILLDWLERIATSNTVQYSAITVRREIYERLGGFFGVTYGEDWEMWVRIASKYPIAYVPEPLAEYRIHEESISGAKLQSAQNVKDLAWVMRTIQHYLPQALRKRVWKASTAFCSRAALRHANSFWRRDGNKQAARRQLFQAFLIHFDREICREAFRLYRDMMFNIR
ncbi:MAG: glycosyltransferase [Pseudomonadota bacterium]